MLRKINMDTLDPDMRMNKDAQREDEIDETSSHARSDSFELDRAKVLRRDEKAPFRLPKKAVELPA